MPDPRLRQPTEDELDDLQIRHSEAKSAGRVQVYEIHVGRNLIHNRFLRVRWGGTPRLLGPNVLIWWQTKRIQLRFGPLYAAFEVIPKSEWIER